MIDIPTNVEYRVVSVKTIGMEYASKEGEKSTYSDGSTSLSRLALVILEVTSVSVRNFWLSSSDLNICRYVSHAGRVGRSCA
jgi:hypothetical protein